MGGRFQAGLTIVTVLDFQFSNAVIILSLLEVYDKELLIETLPWLPCKSNKIIWERLDLLDKKISLLRHLSTGAPV